mgnify:CR=1 FL=1
MKDIQQLFYEKIASITKLSEDFNFQACKISSNNLITSAIMFEYQDGVFIAEVFESVFEQLNGLMNLFELDDEDKEKLKKSFDKNLSIVAESYRKSDKNELYQALSNLRYDVTKIQYKCIQTKERIRNESIIPFPNFR